MDRWLTRDAGIRACQEFFALSDAEVDAVCGAEGRWRLLELWQTVPPTTFYEDPRTLVRQEWYHAASTSYRHDGFWVALDAAAQLLDYGCGVGAVARMPWIMRGGAITLVETSEVCTRYLHHLYDGYANVRICTPETMPATLVDAVICTDVLEHVPDPLVVQQMLWDHLRPGGHALLKFEQAFPHPGHLADSIAQIPAWWQWLDAQAAEIIEMETFVWVRKLES